MVGTIDPATGAGLADSPLAASSERYVQQSDGRGGEG